MHEHDDEAVGPMPEVDMEKLKEKDLQPPIATCTKCKGWAEHIVSAGVARKLYREDKKKEVEKGEPIYAVDLEKVIMLPRMPGIKTAVLEDTVSLWDIFGMRELGGGTTKISPVFTLNSWKSLTMSHAWCFGRTIVPRKIRTGLSIQL